MHQHPEVSIIIRTKNEAAYIKGTLDKIFSQRHQSYEVIVVDSGSTDQTLQIVNDFKVKLIKLPSEEFTYGRALNVGIEESRGDYVVSLSAHAVPFDRDWLKNILVPFANANVAGVVGKALPHPDCNPFDRRGLLRRFGTDRKFLHYDSAITFSNANAAVLKRVWEEEPFDEELPYSEDLKWSRGMMQKGWTFVYEPTATVYHSHNEMPYQLFDRFYNESKARTLMGFAEGRFDKKGLAFDLVAGTLYDLMTSLGKHKSLHWALFSLKRRFWINLGRYFGSRLIAKENLKNPIRTIALRSGLKFLGHINGMLQRLAPVLVATTNRNLGKVHPAELLEEEGQDWFESHLDKSAKVLAVGVEPGKRIVKTATLVDHVFGIDVDHRSLYISNFLARWEEKKNVNLMAAKSGLLPFAENSMDHLLVFEAMKKMRNPMPFLGEAKRVLKKNGKLLIAISNSETPWKNLQKSLGLNLETKNNGKIEYTKKEIVELAGKYGFELYKSEPSNIDTPLAPLMDAVGGVSISIYKKLCHWKRGQALKKPEGSSEFRMVFIKTDKK